MDFKSFKLVQTDMTAQHRVYEGYKTENGVHLEVLHQHGNVGC